MVGHHPPGCANAKAKLDLTIFRFVGKSGLGLADTDWGTQNADPE